MGRTNVSDGNLNSLMTGTTYSESLTTYVDLEGHEVLGNIFF
jgi:hypothetical protein